MKKTILRVILIVLIIANFWSIFNFSSQDGDESSGVSRKVTIAITKNVKNIQEKRGFEKEAILDKIETVVRKMAHLSIYTIQGILMMALMYTYEIKQINRVFISLSIGILYAISDEIHQGFVPGRSPHLTDVLIDSTGVFIGIVAIIGIVEFVKKYIKNSKFVLKNESDNDTI